MQPKKVHRRAKNETSKGLDIEIFRDRASYPPTFGNSEDFKLVYLGTKWCGAGDVAKHENDVGYFYLTGA